MALPKPSPRRSCASSGLSRTPTGGPTLQRRGATSSSPHLALALPEEPTRSGKASSVPTFTPLQGSAATPGATARKPPGSLGNPGGSALELPNPLPLHPNLGRWVEVLLLAANPSHPDWEVLFTSRTGGLPRRPRSAPPGPPTGLHLPQHPSPWTWTRKDRKLVPCLLGPDRSPQSRL